MEIVTTNGKLFIETETRSSGESMGMTYEEIHLKEEITMSKDKLAEVHGKVGMTISIGNYEFLRVDAGVTLPCSKDSIKKAQKEAFDLASEELFKRIREAKETL